MRGTPTSQDNHILSADKIEVKIWVVRYTENKIGNTQAVLFTSILQTPGATTFTTLTQVLSYMYDALFEITHD